jgi:hypothetical protein
MVPAAMFEERARTTAGALGEIAARRSASGSTDVQQKGTAMSIFAIQPKTTFKGAAVIAIAGAILSTVAMTSGAEAARVHRQPPAASDGYDAPPPAAMPYYRNNGQCMLDEGQGRFTPCDSGDGS